VSEAYLTPREAAEYLRSSPSTLAKLRVYGGGPHFCRIGKAIRYRRSDLDAFMSARRVRSTSEPILVGARPENADVVTQSGAAGPGTSTTPTARVNTANVKEVKGADTRR
jgi:excisionase family DNA binding protein